MIANSMPGPSVVYVAGPMRGIPYFNFPAFDRARDVLRLDGHTVISPADLDRLWGFDPYDLDPLTANWECATANWANFCLRSAIRRDLDAVMEADAVALLPGWRDSMGALVEVQMANFLKIHVFEIQERQF